MSRGYVRRGREEEGQINENGGGVGEERERVRELKKIKRVGGGGVDCALGTRCDRAKVDRGI